MSEGFSEKMEIDVQMCAGALGTEMAILRATPSIAEFAAIASLLHNGSTCRKSHAMLQQEASSGCFLSMSWKGFACLRKTSSPKKPGESSTFKNATSTGYVLTFRGAKALTKQAGHLAALRVFRVRRQVSQENVPLAGLLGTGVCRRIVVLSTGFGHVYLWRKRVVGAAVCFLT